MADDLDLIDPPARDVMFRGGVVQIRPLTLGQLPGFARALQPAADELAAAVAGATPATLLRLLAQHGDSVIRALSIASGIDEDTVRGAPVPDSLRLLSAVLQVNRDFLPGRLQTMMRAAVPANPGDGSTPLNP